MSFPFVGAEPPEDALLDRAAFALFDAAPNKADKAAIKRALKSKWKVAFQKRAMAITLPSENASNAQLVAFLQKAHAVSPIALAFRGLRTTTRQRSDAHQQALKDAGRLIGVLAADIAATKNTIGKRFVMGLLFELWVGGRKLSREEHALVADRIEKAAGYREREFFQTMVNEPEELMGRLDAMVWDDRDAIECLGEIADRVLSWGEPLDDIRLEAALALARKLGKSLRDVQQVHERRIAAALWVAYKAGLQSDAKLAKRMRGLVVEHGASASVSLVYCDLRRAEDDDALLKLADEVLAPDAARFYDSGCWAVSRSPELALDLFDRSCRGEDPPWQAANNGVAMLLTVHPRAVPPGLLKLWRERIAAETAAPARHNLACLLARVGETDEARDALLEAIEGGADLEPIAGDSELRDVLDDPAVIAALDARVTDAGERARFEAMRLLVLGRKDAAMDALIAAAKAGMDPDELKYGEPFEALHDDPRMRRVRRPPKKKKRSR